MNVGEATQINLARLSSDVIESSAQVILEVAKAVGARLELSEDKIGDESTGIRLRARDEREPDSFRTPSA
jgi:hypothetical protein